MEDTFDERSRRMDEMERRIERNFELIERQQDEMLVMNRMMNDQRSMIIDHQAWLENLTLSEANHRKWREQAEAFLVRLDEKIEQIAELILRGKSGNGHPPEPEAVTSSHARPDYPTSEHPQKTAILI